MEDIPDDPEWNGRITDAAATKLSSLVTEGVTGLRYVCDMGDNWQHRIIVEKVILPNPESHTPSSSARTTMPAGGLRRRGGPLRISRQHASKQIKKCKATLDWYRRAYDPDDIDENQP